MPRWLTRPQSKSKRWRVANLTIGTMKSVANPKDLSRCYEIAESRCNYLSWPFS